MKEEVKYKVVKELGCLSDNPEGKGWQKEMRVMQWGDKPPMYDIRKWNKYVIRVGNGLSLTKSEARRLRDLLNNLTELDEDGEPGSSASNE